MGLLISKVDITLVIPPKMRGIFPNKEKLVIVLIAETPKEVPDYVLNYYIKNRPKVFRNGSKPAPVEPPRVEITEPIKFDAVEFINSNYSQIEEALKTLDRRSDILAVAKALGLKGTHKQKNDRIIERIIHDVMTKNAQQEKLNKHKTED